MYWWASTIIMFWWLQNPSLQDPHGELTGQNVLIVRGSLEETAKHFSLEVSHVKKLLEECREKLYTLRQGRPRPHRDDKILTAWNGEPICETVSHIPIIIVLSYCTKWTNQIDCSIGGGLFCTYTSFKTYTPLLQAATDNNIDNKINVDSSADRQ